MKILYDQTTGHIVATALDEYAGACASITAPEGFDPSQMDRSLIVDGSIVPVQGQTVTSASKRPNWLKAALQSLMP